MLFIGLLLHYFYVVVKPQVVIVTIRYFNANVANKLEG